MKLYSPKERGQGSGLCRRQSPLRGAVGSLIVCAILIGAPLLWRHLGAPWPVWAGFAALAALLVPFLIGDALAKFRPTNWLLWVRPDGLWVNLRSYQNRHLPDAATVLHLPHAEVARARRHVATWSTPGSARTPVTTQWKAEFLELNLSSGDTGPVARALADERKVRATVRGKHQAVTVPAPGVVRLAWRGAGNDTVPPLDRVLDELGRLGIELADPTRTDRADWRQFSRFTASARGRL